MKATHPELDFSLRSVLERTWIANLHRSSSPFFWKKALDFAEQHNLRAFQGHIYYHEMIHINLDLCAYDSNLSTTYDFGNGFNLRQSKTLYRGFKSLLFFWDHLRDVPRELGGKDHDSACAQKWYELWVRGGVTKVVQDRRWELPAGLVFPPLQALRIMARSGGGESDTTCGCHFAVQAREYLRKLSSEMADHFLGPPHGDSEDCSRSDVARKMRKRRVAGSGEDEASGPEKSSGSASGKDDQEEV
ncbi:hypothetical protein HYPSUDRAFT_898415 [Hypholoma sublateritium FD-334 SS-4]|uniref:Uncharacterized protein n=1 Tax=Hypholoma sublateritium (strain FD-334 SS-4) TaxID=945553 RepID=A0A0D2M7M6_HYPSF|nr:hypothetical protein HYPSUDRAFT_898415 [Hypholoma sublateritium FD-334 SS-4]